MRLSPNDPVMWAYMASRSMALTLLEHYEEALDWARRAIQFPNSALYARVAILAAAGKLERPDESAGALEWLRQERPWVSVAFLQKTLPISDPDCRDRFETGLRKAGLSE